MDQYHPNKDPFSIKLSKEKTLSMLASTTAVGALAVGAFVGMEKISDPPKSAEEACAGKSTLEINSPTTLRQISVHIDNLHIGSAREALLRYNPGIGLEQKLPEGKLVVIPIDCR